MKDSERSVFLCFSKKVQLNCPKGTCIFFCVCLRLIALSRGDRVSDSVKIRKNSKVPIVKSGLILMRNKNKLKSVAKGKGRTDPDTKAT